MRYTIVFILLSVLSIQFCLADEFADLMNAVRNQNLEEIERLYPASKIGMPAIERWRPIHEASYWNCVQSAEKLLELGEDLNVSDGNGWTPLYVARNKSHIEMIALLYSKGAR